MNLPRKIENDLSNASFQESTFQTVAGDSVIKGLFALVATAVDPSGISTVAVLAGLLSNIGDSLLKRRQNAFFEELKAKPNMLTEDVVKSEEFVHKFLITYKAVVMTHKAEKIKYLAKLLKSSTISENDIDVDEYEEYLNIITDLSYRELQILSIIDKNYKLDPEPSKPTAPSMNADKTEWRGRFFAKNKHDIQKELGVRSQEIDDVLIRISRSALYKQIGYTAGENGDGVLTPLFYRIKELIEFE